MYINCCLFCTKKKFINAIAYEFNGSFSSVLHVHGYFISSFSMQQVCKLVVSLGQGFDYEIFADILLIAIASKYESF